MANKQERTFPTGEEKKHLAYIVSIKGTDGNLELLEELFEKDKGQGAEKTDMLSGYNPVISFAVKTTENVEFDLFHYVNEGPPRRRTNSRTFRRQVGPVLTVLLQAGYTISQYQNTEARKFLGENTSSNRPTF